MMSGIVLLKTHVGDIHFIGYSGFFSISLNHTIGYVLTNFKMSIVPKELFEEKFYFFHSFEDPIEFKGFVLESFIVNGFIIHAWLLWFGASRN